MSTVATEVVVERVAGTGKFGTREGSGVEEIIKAGTVCGVPLEQCAVECLDVNWYRGGLWWWFGLRLLLLWFWWARPSSGNLIPFVNLTDELDVV
jgi:hypothetical protein